MEIPIFVSLTIIEGSAFEHVAKKIDSRYFGKSFPNLLNMVSSYICIENQP